jgi:diguanylate cyclase (GGDEF)-like protein/PAS domain S-box-containing protein
VIDDAEFEKVRSENEALLEFLYLCPVGLIQFTPTGQVDMMNPLAAQLLMPIAAAAMINDVFATLERFAPDLRSLVESYPEPRGVICENRRIVVRASDEDGLILACTLIKIEEGRLMAVLTDVSEQVAQERRLRQAESWFAAILSGVNDFALLSLDANGRVAGWNASGERQTGYSRADMLGRTLNVFYLPDEAVQGRALQQVDLARRDGWHIDEGWRRRKDGSRYWCQSLVSAMEEKSGDISGFSVVLRDVTERKRSGDEIRRLLTVDHLTGVLNRARFYELAEAEIARFKRFGQPLSALMLDIDHFKLINDGYGHAAGDVVLKNVADAVQHGLRSIDVAGRLGGEEFAVFLPSIDLEGARMVAERLRNAVAGLRPSLGGEPKVVTVSVGCASMRPGMTDVDSLLKEADAALYRAKAEGRNRVIAQGGKQAA